MTIPRELTLTQAREAVRGVRVKLSWDSAGLESALIGLEFDLVALPCRRQLALPEAERGEP